MPKSMPKSMPVPELAAREFTKYGASTRPSTGSGRTVYLPQNKSMPVPEFTNLKAYESLNPVRAELVEAWTGVAVRIDPNFD